METLPDDGGIPPGITIRRLRAVEDAQIEGLAELLVDSIDGGASVSFMHPLAPAKARAFWRHVADGVATGGRALLVAEDETGIVGTVQLVLDLPENQPHRADLVNRMEPRRRDPGLRAAVTRRTLPDHGLLQAALIRDEPAQTGTSRTRIR